MGQARRDEGARGTEEAVTTPEAIARITIDDALENSGWVVQDMNHLNLFAGCGVAVREFPLLEQNHMRELAEDMGGSLLVESVPGSGTRVHARIPLILAQSKQ